MGVKVAQTPFPGTDQKFSLGPARNFLSRGRSAKAAALNRTAAGEELDQGDDDGHYQQKVDQPAADVDREAQQPEHEQDYGNCPKHHGGLSIFVLHAPNAIACLPFRLSPTANFCFHARRSDAQKSG